MKKKETELRAESSQRAWLGADFVSTLPAASLLNFSLDSVRVELFPKSPLTWAKQEGSVYFSVKRMPPRSTTLFSSSFHLKSGVHRHLLAYHPNKNHTTSPGNPVSYWTAPLLWRFVLILHQKVFLFDPSYAILGYSEQVQSCVSLLFFPPAKTKVILAHWFLKNHML